MKFYAILLATVLLATTTPALAQEMRSIQMPDGSTMMFPVEPGSTVMQGPAAPQMQQRRTPQQQGARPVPQASQPMWGPLGAAPQLPSQQIVGRAAAKQQGVRVRCEDWNGPGCDTDYPYHRPVVYQDGSYCVGGHVDPMWRPVPRRCFNADGTPKQ